MALAVKWRRPSIYDCLYAALADLKNCELWTADERFFNAVKDDFPLVRLLGQSV